MTIHMRPKSHRQTISLHTLVMSQESSRMKCSLAQAYISLSKYIYIYTHIQEIIQRGQYTNIKKTHIIVYKHVSWISPTPTLPCIDTPHLAHHFKTCDFGTSRSETWQQILHIKLEIACSLLQIV